jgi:hypothetical protein
LALGRQGRLSPHQMLLPLFLFLSHRVSIAFDLHSNPLLLDLGSWKGRQGTGE